MNLIIAFTVYLDDEDVNKTSTQRRGTHPTYYVPWLRRHLTIYYQISHFIQLTSFPSQYSIDQRFSSIGMIMHSQCAGKPTVWYIMSYFDSHIGGQPLFWETGSGWKVNSPVWIVMEKKIYCTNPRSCLSMLHVQSQSKFRTYPHSCLSMLQSVTE